MLAVFRFARPPSGDGSGKARTRVFFGLACLSIAIAGLLVLAVVLLQRRLYEAPRPMANAYYVWQMQWTDSVREAVAVAAPEADRLMVLLGEVNVAGDVLTFASAKPDWGALAQERAQTALVLRANVSLGALLAPPQAGLDKAGDYLHEILDGALTTAQEAGVQVAGVQLDYDCPTSKLNDYRRLLDALDERLGDTDLSVTVLPTWLKQWDFPRLVDGLAYYVLQVHSLETPTTVDQPIVLCDTARIPGYLRRAAWVGVPFYLALPTYGYRVAFDAEGQFRALSAEGPLPAWDPSYQIRLVMAEPEEIAQVVQSVMAAPPRGCRGFAWFRLPHSQDELNWPWPTLQAVREGRVPRTAFKTEVRNPSSGLYEVWVTNVGETHEWSDIAFDVRWENDRLLAYDVIGGFQGEPDRDTQTLHLVGPAPRENESTMTAWIRMEPSDADQSGSVKSGPAIVIE